MRRGTCIAQWMDVHMSGAGDANRRSFLMDRSIHVMALQN